MIEREKTALTSGKWKAPSASMCMCVHTRTHSHAVLPLRTSAPRARLHAGPAAAHCPASRARQEPEAGRWAHRALKRCDSSLGTFQAWCCNIWNVRLSSQGSPQLTLHTHRHWLAGYFSHFREQKLTLNIRKKSPQILWTINRSHLPQLKILSATVKTQHSQIFFFLMNKSHQWPLIYTFIIIIG